MKFALASISLFSSYMMILIAAYCDKSSVNTLNQSKAMYYTNSNNRVFMLRKVFFLANFTNICLLLASKHIHIADKIFLNLQYNCIGFYLFVYCSIICLLSTFLDHKYILGLSIVMYGINQILHTVDFFNMYIGYEIMLIGVILCMIKSHFKLWKTYLTIQMIASFFIFIGSGFFYLYNGNLSIFQNVAPNISSYVMLIGFLMKAGIYPFGLWIKIYSYIPNEILFWISAIITKISLYSIIVLMPHLMHIDLLFYVASISAIVGSILAYQSSKSKQILSFHIMSQVSVILLIALFEFKAKTNLYLTLIYIIHHMWTKSTLFLLQKNHNHKYMFQYAICSLIGVPITPGFVAKMLAIYMMIQHQYYDFAGVMVCTSLLTACSMEKLMNQKLMGKNLIAASNKSKSNKFANHSTDLQKENQMSNIMNNNSMTISYISLMCSVVLIVFLIYKCHLFN